MSFIELSDLDLKKLRFELSAPTKTTAFLLGIREAARIDWAIGVGVNQNPFSLCGEYEKWHQWIGGVSWAFRQHDWEEFELEVLRALEIG